MIRVPGKFAYVFNPRTGSRAMEQAFLASVPGAQDVGRHHGYSDCPEPTYATIRDPVEVAISFWWSEQCRGRVGSLEQWYRKSGSRFNLHLDKIDRYFLYDLGLEEIFNQLGYPGVSVPRIGGHSPPQATAEQRAYLIDKFPEDWELYQQVREHSCEKT